MSIALWEYEKTRGSLPVGTDDDVKVMMGIAEDLRVRLAINEKALKSVDAKMIE